VAFPDRAGQADGAGGRAAGSSRGGHRPDAGAPAAAGGEPAAAAQAARGPAADHAPPGVSGAPSVAEAVPPPARSAEEEAAGRTAGSAPVQPDPGGTAHPKTSPTRPPREEAGRETPPATPRGDASPGWSPQGEAPAGGSRRRAVLGTRRALSDGPAPGRSAEEAADARRRAVAGIVDQDGEILAGSGFTVARRMTGVYTVGFPPGVWRAGHPPVPVATAYIQNALVAVGHISADARGSACFSVLCNDAAGYPLDCAFSFIVVLP